MADMIRNVEHGCCPGLPRSRYTMDENCGESGVECVGFITSVDAGTVLAAVGR